MTRDEAIAHARSEALRAVYYVGRANYADREREAMQWVREAFSALDAIMAAAAPEEPDVYKIKHMDRVIAGAELVERSSAQEAPGGAKALEPTKVVDADRAGTARRACIDSRHRVGGDHLWVRETWAAPHNCDHLKPREIDRDWRIHYAASEDRGGLLWRPSIHMPRWASRITLEITGVRVERLQDISEADALAEGVLAWAEGACAKGNPHGLDPQGYYELLWSAINGRESWDANPWVWCLSFRRIDTPDAGGGG